MEYWYAYTGPKHWMDLHIANMQSIPVYIPGIAPNGQTFQQPMNLIYEPIQLVRVIFPREVLPVIVNTLGGTRDKGLVMNAASSIFRKALGLEPIPEMSANSAKLPVSTDYLNIIPIGIKDDGPDRIMATTGVRQEPI